MHAVRRGWYAGLVRHRRNCAEGLRWLRVSENLAVYGIDTREILVLAFTALERPILRVVGCVVVAANAVEDMFAEVTVVCAGGVTSLKAEGVAADEPVVRGRSMSDDAVIVGALTDAIGSPADRFRYFHHC